MARKNRTPEEKARREKSLSMYAKGMTAGDIEAHIQDIYGICVSDSTVSRITDKICPSCGSGSNGRWRGPTP